MTPLMLGLFEIGERLHPVILMALGLIVLVVWGLLSIGPLRRHRTLGGWCVIGILFIMVINAAGAQHMLMARVGLYLRSLTDIEEKRPNDLAHCVRRIPERILGGPAGVVELNDGLTREFRYLRSLLFQDAPWSWHGPDVSLTPEQAPRRITAAPALPGPPEAPGTAIP
jgi:hypothetical protein